MIVRLSESEDLGHLRSLGKTTGHVRQDGRRGKEEYSNQSNGILSVLSVEHDSNTCHHIKAPTPIYASASKFYCKRLLTCDQVPGGSKTVRKMTRAAVSFDMTLHGATLVSLFGLFFLLDLVLGYRTQCGLRCVFTSYYFLLYSDSAFELNSLYNLEGVTSHSAHVVTSPAQPNFWNKGYHRSSYHDLCCFPSPLTVFFVLLAPCEHTLTLAMVN